VTWDNYGNWIVMICLANGAECVRTANSTRNFSIRASLAIRDSQKGLPTIFLKLRSNQIEVKRKFTQFSAKVGLQLRNIGPELFRRFNPDFVFPGSWHRAFVKMEASQALFSGRKQQRPYYQGINPNEINCF